MAEKTQTRRGPLGWVKRHKKLTIFLVILLVAALILVNVLGKTDKAAAVGSYQFVRTTVLTKTTLSDTVSVTGTVKAGSSASVRNGAKIFLICVNGMGIPFVTSISAQSAAGYQSYIVL